jgi:signal transduction histidine kinase
MTWRASSRQLRQMIARFAARSRSRARGGRPCLQAEQGGLQQERILDALDALLALAVSQAGTSRHEPVDLSEVTAARLHAADARIQRQRLHLQASLSSATLYGDPDLIERLTANLLDNAIRHNTPAGTIDITTGASNGHAVLTVANTGPLIPPAEVSRLFQPFQRLAARTSNG